MVSAASRVADAGGAAQAAPHRKEGSGASGSGFSQMLDSQMGGMSAGNSASKAQPGATHGSNTTDRGGSKEAGQNGAHHASGNGHKPKATDHGKAKPGQDGKAHKHDQGKQTKSDKGETKPDKGHAKKGGDQEKKADKKAKGKSDGTDAKAAPYVLLNGTQAQATTKPGPEALVGPGGKGLPAQLTQQDMATVIANATSASSDKGGDGKAAKGKGDPLQAFEKLLDSKDTAGKAAQAGAKNANATDTAAAVRALARLGGNNPSAQGGGGNGGDNAAGSGGQQASAPAPLAPATTANASANPSAGATPQQPPANLQLSVPMRAQGWNQAFAQRITWMAKQGVQQAQIELNPRNLGPIQVHLSVNHDQASVQFVAHNPHAREALQAAMPRLKEMMGENGMNLAQSQVAQQGFQQQAQQQFGSGQGGSGAGTGSGAGGTEEDVAAIEGAHVLNGGTSLSAVDYFA